MKTKRGCLMLAGTALYLGGLVALGLYRIARRRCGRWLRAHLPWDQWQTQPPC